MDLPGFGYSKMSHTEQEKVGKFIEEYLFNRKNIACIVLLIDIRHNPSENDIMKCAEFLLTYIGFDMNKGVLGIYPHGFTEKIGNNDIRIAFKRNGSGSLISLYESTLK